MLEMGTSGLMSGVGKRGDALAPAPASGLDSTDLPGIPSLEVPVNLVLPQCKRLLGQLAASLFYILCQKQYLFLHRLPNQHRRNHISFQVVAWT
jgi:hypothetical protein